MHGTHLNIIYETEMEQFLSEKLITREGVTVVTLTNGSSFAAKNLNAYDQKVISR